MKPTILVFIILMFTYANELRPNGGYLSIEDFLEGKVTYQPHAYELKYEYVSLNRANNPEPIGARIIYALSPKKRIWSERKQGPLYLVNDDGYLFLYPNIGRLHLYQNYSWFTKVKIISGTHVTGSGMMVSTGPYNRVKHYVMNMKTGEVQRLDKDLLREILKEKPEILVEFEKETFKKSSLLPYLIKFLKATNESSLYN